MTDHSPTLNQNELRIHASRTQQRGSNQGLSAAILLIAAALEYWAIEAITALAWKTPMYNYAFNFISDLGVPSCSTFQGRVICSPLHNLMNTGFIAQGVLFFIASLLLLRLFSGPSRYVYLVLALIYSIGFILVGTFHGSTAATENGTIVYHYLGAFMSILGGNIIAIGTGFQWRHLETPRWFGRMSIVLGIIGIVSAVILFPTIGSIPSGIPERISVYTILLWQILLGIVLLVDLRQRSRVHI